MNRICVSKNKIHEGNLILVNAAHPLQKEERKGLVPVSPEAPDIFLRRDAAGILQVILEKISAKGEILPVSGYRSQGEQTKIYSDSIKENGVDFTKKYVALPGHSEHQTGMAIDLGLRADYVDFIRPAFPYDGICETFRKTAPSYGFVERYPAAKERITGIAHEPWHFRYVGYPHSAIMAERGLALEEYVDFIRGYTAAAPLRYKATKVFYAPAAGEQTEIALPPDALYQLSGNNVDGFIVSIWRTTHEQ